MALISWKVSELAVPVPLCGHILCPDPVANWPGPSLLIHLKNSACSTPAVPVADKQLPLKSTSDVMQKQSQTEDLYKL